MADYGVVVQNGTDNWLNALGNMIENLTEAQSQAKELQPMAMDKWTMERNVLSTITLYEKIIVRRRSIPALPGIYWINWEKENNGKDAT